ncbi:MAG: hypothetical protein LBD53_03225 [Tannerella sp.]|nr:hypothetical protein [Tannerella sp.]
MKDITITAKRQKTELKWFAGSILVGIVFNIIAITMNKTNWSELWTQMLWVMLVSFAFYMLSVAARGGIYLLMRLFTRKQ